VKARSTRFISALPSAVALALAAFNYVSEKEKMDDLEIHPEEDETRAQDL
jgi:hypothetical protein